MTASKKQFQVYDKDTGSIYHTYESATHARARNKADALNNMNDTKAYHWRLIESEAA